MPEYQIFAILVSPHGVETYINQEVTTSTPSEANKLLDELIDKAIEINPNRKVIEREINKVYVPGTSSPEKIKKPA
jgi:FMN-dependent NADH-azoreductase